ncbi:MAG TPA: hypothetical protein VN493_13960 [Thermoanaerobaculia bacterium]|nr:hypothetical protein [Thermoanaerobaculia bacterium]
MTLKPELFQTVLVFLARWRGLTHKEIAARSGRKIRRVIHLLTGERAKPLPEAGFREMLPALEARPAHAAVTAAWLEALEALDREEGGLTPEERDALELWQLGVARELREAAAALVLRSREAPPLDEYPQPRDVEPARWLARVQILLLEPLPHDERLAAVRSIRKYQHWALAEALAHESERAASQDLKKAEVWARLAVEVAGCVRGPEGWQKRIRGYAAAAGPNVLRVRGRLDEADTGLGEANRLWMAGSDPDRILDPGRLPDLEASLRRAQRRFPEATGRANEALAVTHYPGRVLVKRAFIEEAMGEYERALETLEEAEPHVRNQGDRRLRYQQKFNRAVLYSHLTCFAEAEALVEEVHDLATGLGDAIFLNRVTWLRGRIAAGLGRPGRARTLLEQALWEFADGEMWFDVALAVLEIATLLLREGKTEEVRKLTPPLALVFKAGKIHREALAALRLFEEAVEQETATAELAGRVLRFLFRARSDQGLEFKS